MAGLWNLGMTQTAPLWNREHSPRLTLKKSVHRKGLRRQTKIELTT